MKIDECEVGQYYDVFDKKDNSYRFTVEVIEIKNFALTKMIAVSHKMYRIGSKFNLFDERISSYNPCCLVDKDVFKIRQQVKEFLDE